jgi:hypothetical protein
MRILVVLVTLSLLFTIVISLDNIRATSIPIEEQLRLAREKNSTAETNDLGIQPEDRFTINEPNEDKAPPPVKILSQNSEYELNQGVLQLWITGEVMNVSPTGEVIGGDKGGCSCCKIDGCYCCLKLLPCVKYLAGTSYQ